MRRIILSLSAVAAVAMAGTAQAGTILVDSGNSVVTVSSFDPLGQSFIANGTQLQTISVQFATLAPTAPLDDITIALRLGEGVLTGASLASRTITPVNVGRNDTKVFTDFDFSGVTLIAGASYTIGFTSAVGSGGRSGLVYGPDPRPFPQTGFDMFDPYAGGRLYTSGSFCTETTRTCDLNFRVVTADTAAPVPEPATWAMMIAGFGLVGGSLRRHGAAQLMRA